MRARTSNGGRATRHGSVPPEVAEFVATAAHEIRLPLTVISGLAATLRQHRSVMSEVDLDNALDSMVRQSARMAALVDDLLDLARLESGYRPPRAAVGVAELVGDALELAPPPVSTAVRVTQSEPGLAVYGDRPSIVRLLVNLVSNAYRYGGQKIVIASSRDAGHAVITVSDDGAGVPTEAQDALFEPFTRGANAGTVAGAGLGLALSRRLAESVDSELSYADGDPHGATFTVRVPLAPPA